MGWNGGGQQLRSCTEEQLAALCPYQAFSTGIDSPKHRPGAFVPIPARHMIGQVIARYVAEKKTREKQIEDVHSRLEEERRRPSIATGPYPGFESMQDPSLSRSVSQASRRSRAQPLLPRASLEQQPAVGFGPVVWTEQAVPINGACVPASTTIPAHMFSGPYMSGALNGISYDQFPSSPISSQSSAAHYQDMLSLQSQSNGRSPRAQHQSLQRMSSVQSGHEPPADLDELEIADARTIHPSRPQRYAPRRPSGLRASSTTDNTQGGTTCNTVPLRKGQAVDFASSNSEVAHPSRPLGFIRRRSSLAGSRLAGETIQEAIDEHADSPRHKNDARKTTRQDSGVENDPYGNSFFSSSSPAFLTNASPISRDTSSPAPKLSRSSSTAGSGQQHHAWSAPRSRNTLPVANQMSRSVSFDLGHDEDQAVVRFSRPLFQGSKSKVRNESIASNTNRDRGDELREKELSEQYLAVEVEFQRLRKLRDEAVTRLPTPPPGPCLRKAQSDKTLYSSLDPIEGIYAGNKPFQYKPAPSHHPPKLEAKPRDPTSQSSSQTLMEALEENQARSTRSSRMQEAQRRKHSDATAS